MAKKHIIGVPLSALMAKWSIDDHYKGVERVRMRRERIFKTVKGSEAERVHLTGRS